MKDYTKIDTFDNLYQAELRKDILLNNNIEAFVVNKRDNMFIIGSIELYTKSKDEKKAKQILSQFYGLTKINSFVELKPLLIFQKILQNSGIECKLKKKENEDYILDNYELYVKNEDADKTIPFVNGEKLLGRTAIKICKRVRQAQLFFNILNDNGIETLTVKTKDSNYHLQEILLYVKKEEADKAKSMLEKPEGYILLRTADNYTKIEVDEETLAEKNIISLIRPVEDQFDLLVKNKDYELADEILSQREEWVELKSFNDMPQAIYYKHMLEQELIRTVILNEKDHSFLIGNIELYVEKRNRDKALSILKSI
ncbi:MAG: DUF2007 domain-containing protein [Bacteroidota bacterium]|nr:DUF2007 domain-containing protein [Bacteroidota bacterium]